MQKYRISQLIQSGMFFLAALLPLVFSPFAAEWLDFAKVSLLLLIPSLLLFVFFWQQRKNNAFSFSWTFLDQAVLMFGLLFALATLFSKNTAYSLIGFDIYYGYTLGAAVGGILFYFLLRFQARQNGTQQTLWLLFFLGGSAASTLELIAQVTGLLPGQLVNIISPAVAPTSLFLLFLLFIGEYQLRQEKKITGQLLVGSCILLNLIHLFVSTPDSMWMVLAMLTAFFILLIRKNTTQQISLLPLWSVLIFGLLAVFLPLTSGKEQAALSISPASRLELVSQTVQHHPLFGVGPNNTIFAFDYYRPLRLNNEPQALLTFVTSSDVWTELLIATGIIGLVAWLFLWIRLLPYKPWRSTHLAGPLLCTLFVAGIFSSFTIVHWLLLWMGLATVVNQHLEHSRATVSIHPVSRQMILSLLFSTAVFFLITIWGLGKIWLAESYHFQAETIVYKAGKWEEAALSLQQAADTNPNSIAYQLDVASHLAYQAQFMTLEENKVTAARAAEVRQALAILASVLADPGRNTLTLQRMAAIAETLRPLSPEADIFLEKLYQSWLQDQVNHPLPPYFLATLYLRQENEAETAAREQNNNKNDLLIKARKYLNVSLKLKPDYQPAQDVLSALEER